MLDFFSEHSFLLAQIFGFIAMFVAIITYQFNKRKTIMLMLIINPLIWCIHYAFMGLYAPIAINFIGAVRNVIYTYYHKEGKYSVLMPIFFAVVSSIAVLLTWENSWNILTLLGGIICSFAAWQKKPKNLRALTLPECFCWLTYNIANKSWAGTCNEIFRIISITVALIRYDIPKKEKK